jgi:hypothetical protein
MSENLPRLYYLSDNKSELLPEWAYFFMRLGYQLATVPNDHHRVVIGLAIPTRVFACSLVAIGIVLARAGSEICIGTTQLKYIRSLKPGTPVYVRTDNNRKLRGVVENFEEYNGEQYIFIRTAKLGKRGYLLNRYASRITVSDRNVSLPKYQQSGYLIEAPGKFLQCCLGKKLAQKYILDSSFEALLIGKKSVIEHEISEIPFSCKISNNSTGVSGCLQEILRVRQFSGANKSYRTQYVSSLNITPEKEIGTQSPPSVVFDGAIAYIKLGHKWRSAHQIALLDRTERQFTDAIGLLNQNYAYRLAGGFKFPIKIPDGIEMMVYRDSVQ